MTAPKMTAREALNSLTGFDELAIEQAFGKDVDELGGRALVRALIFVLERRGGASDRDAKKTALELPYERLDDWFEPFVEEPLEDEPESEQGKDSSASD